MALRRGHGNGAGEPRVEVLPADELPAANAADTATELAIRRQRGRPFELGNHAAAGRRPKLALLGVTVDATDPRYALALRRAARYATPQLVSLAGPGGPVSYQVVYTGWKIVTPNYAVSSGVSRNGNPCPALVNVSSPVAADPQVSLMRLFRGGRFLGGPLPGFVAEFP